MRNISKNISKLFNPIIITLSLSGLASMISGLLSGLLLIEISETFNIPVAIAGQLNTISFIISVIFAILTSMLTLKYNHKHLLQVGLIIYVLSSIGCFLAPNFKCLLVSFSLTGVGYALTTTMAFTLVPELFPTEKRGEVIGWIIAGMSGSYLIGAFTVPYLQGIGGWRVTFLGYMLPFSLIALLFATLFIPGKLLKGLSNDGLEFRKSYLEIFSNRSALFSLFGYLLAMVPWQAIMTFNSSFFREWFSLSIGEASILILFGASLYTFGSIVSGKFVNRIGKKPLTVISIIFAGFVIMGYSFLPSVWLCGGCLCFSCLLVGVMDTASTGLIIEQSPLYVGIMMSLHRAVTQIGFSVGSGLGGFMLLVYGYRSMFLGLGFLGLLSGMVFHFFTSDPTI